MMIRNTREKVAGGGKKKKFRHERLRKRKERG